MLRTLILFSLLSLTSICAYAKDDPSSPDNPRIYFETDLGKMVIELYPKKAPITVANFLQYVDSGFYEGTIFHRVIDNFVVQGGGLAFDFSRKETKDPIANESHNKLLNLQATLSMARTSDPESATSQFFINLKHNEHLDPQDEQLGYAVFAKVVEGFDVVKKIEKEPKGLYRSHPQAPNYPVRILRAGRVQPQTPTAPKTVAVEKS
ncbi:peptidylprolyl isomerase [Teredinibacter haidensis]|uniref:peptidylprolyl isomerase n=1 Tax=Teredinibacter haidensis TaxID=2731755 RepID=UPI0009491410|nr:peptidylprolyl isomerase [Teredinibacter haidensis]